MSESEMKEPFLPSSDSDSRSWEDRLSNSTSAISPKATKMPKKNQKTKSVIRRIFRRNPRLYKSACLLLLTLCLLSVYIFSNWASNGFKFSLHREHLISAQLQRFQAFMGKDELDYDQRLYGGKEKLLIDTAVCRLKESPLWGGDVLQEFENHFNKMYDCDDDAKKEDKVQARRINFNQVIIDELDSESGKSPDWDCIGSEVYNEKDDYEIDEKNSRPMQHVTAFNSTEGHPWDSVQVYCVNSKSKATYKIVIPLVQDHINRRDTENADKKRPKTNVIMLGLDSVSRQNMQRHLRLTKAVYEENGFVEMLGYHKIGENTFPNIVGMLTGYPYSQFYNFSMEHHFKWDTVPLLWKEFRAHNYTTAFFEDMPPYAVFGPRGGFKDQPTDYYTRPTQKLFWRELTNSHSCYKGKIEDVIYWKYLFDLLTLYHKEENRNLPYFTFMHMSTFTHNYFNHAGYIDLPYALFFKRLFQLGYDKDTVIMSFADHSLRFGGIVDTDANVQEAMLPYFWIYIPDSLVLDGRNATELRKILRDNQRRLSSHFDAHATARHILYGFEPKDEKYGKSFLSPIPTTRTCSDAGISAEYCMCNSYDKLTLPASVQQATSQFAVEHINANILSEFPDLCANLTLIETHRVFQSVDRESNKYRWLTVFKTSPNSGLYQAIIDIKNGYDSTDKQNNQSLTPPPFERVLSTTRLSRYASQSDCITNRHDMEPYCYCKNLLKN